MCAHVDEGVNFRNMPKPKGEREQCVTRRQSRVVIGCSAIRRPAPVRRERDDNVTERPRTEVECAVTHITVVFDVAPCVLHPLACVKGKGASELAILIERESSVDRWVEQGIQQGTRASGRASNIIVRVLQVRQQRNHARGHIKAYGVTGATRRARIIGQQYCHPAFSTRFRPKLNQRRDPVRENGNAVELRQTSECGEPKVIVCWQWLLERNHAL